MTSRRLLALGAIAALAATGAACSPQDETPTTAPPTSAESTTPSPTETTPAETTTPAIPAPDPADFPGKDEHTEEGAKQAYAYYWASAIHAYQTGDLRILEPLQAQECKECGITNEEVTTLTESDALWSPTTFTVDRLELEDLDDAEFVIRVEFRTSAHTEVDPDSGARVDEPETRYVSVGGVDWSDGRWLVSGYAIITPDSSEDAN